jgi:uncharacterized membrane protein
MSMTGKDAGPYFKQVAAHLDGEVARPTGWKEDQMELCILRFEGSHGAEDALKDVSDAESDRNAWLHEVAMVARPALGRVRIGVTFPDGKSNTFHEGELGDAVSALGAYTGYFISALAGPLGSMSRIVGAADTGGELGSEAEERLFHLDEIKKALPRDSSALALIANTEICDKLVDLFSSYEPKVIRRDVADELSKRLEGLHRRVTQDILKAKAGPEATTH